MTAPISIKYEDWVAVIDDANKAQERVKKLEAALQLIIAYNPLEYAWSYNEDAHQKFLDIARKALEE